MDVQQVPHFSSSFTLDDALEHVGHNLVYDPLTKQLCLRNQLNKKIKDTFSSNTEDRSSSNKCDQKSDVLSCDLKLALYHNDKLNQLNCSTTDSTTQKFDEIHVNHHSDSSKIVLLQQLFGKFSFIDKFKNNEIFESKCHQLLENELFDNLSTFQRPPNLPPKTKDEERKHLAEFNEIVKQVKRKKLKELKERKQSLAKQIRQEEEVSEAIRVWTYEILPSWSSSHTTKRSRDLWWNGIPSPVRPKVWTISIGNGLRITKELYEICIELSKEKIWYKPSSLTRRSSSPPLVTSIKKIHRRSASHLEANKLNSKYDNYDNRGCEEWNGDDMSESTAFLIKLDVSRTFPQLGFFQETGPYHNDLADILAAYAVYRPDLGYCQGMSFLAAMLFLNLDSQLDTFTAFANLFHNELLLAFYKLDEGQMKAVYQYYEQQLEALFPKLARHFASVGLSTDLFLVYQIYTLLSRSLPLECVCRVWDLFFRDGNEFIFRASLAILAMYQEELLKLEFIDLAKFLSILPDNMDIERYFSMIHSIKLVPPKLSECLQQRPSMPYSKSFSNHKNSTLVKKLFTFF